jgi:hypothetical protein
MAGNSTSAGHFTPNETNRTRPSMKLHRILIAGAACLALVPVGRACIEELDLAKMVAKTDAAVRGTITDVRTVRYTPPGDDRLIFTVLTVEGTDLYTGQARTIEAAFLGGVHQGDSMMVTSMPAPSEYRLGNQVLLFSAPVEGWGPEVDRCVYAAMGGIFREVAAKQGAVVLGKGEGFAVERNVRLADLQTAIAREAGAKR